MDKPIEQKVERQPGEVSITVTLRVPVGDKVVSVTAYDANNEPLAVGSTNITVLVNITTTATVELGEIKGAFFPLKVGNEWVYDLTITNLLGDISKPAKQGLPDYVPYPFEAKGIATWEVISYEENLFPSPVYALQMTHTLTSISPPPDVEPLSSPPKVLPRSPSITAYLSGGTVENLLLWGLKNDCPECQCEDELARFVPPLVILDLSLSSTWQVGRAFGLIWSASYAGEENIETPIGTFPCVKVVYTSTPIAVSVKKSGREDVPARATATADVWYADKVGVVKEVLTIIPSGYSPSMGRQKPIWQCTYTLKGTNLLSGDVEVIVK